MSNATIKILLLLQFLVGTGNGSTDCESPLGMENKRIPDSAIKATTEVFSKASDARFVSGGHLSWTSWIPETDDLGEWIQIDLGQITMITKIATQGGTYRTYWVTEYKVSYSLNGGHFKFYRQPSNNSLDKVFQANVDNNSTVFNILDPPIVTRFIRLHPVNFHDESSLRMELYGCYSGFPTPKPPVCEEGLGLENYAIDDKFLTASSSFWENAPSNAGIGDAPSDAANGRLHLFPTHGSRGGWVGYYNVKYGNWFQVEFRSWTKVTRISTQGRQDEDNWVTKYRVTYSYDGIFFKDYQENGTDVKVFLSGGS